MKSRQKFFVGILCSMLFAISVVFYSDVSAENTVPAWVKNTALWYGEGSISESDFLNAIKYLIENDILVLDSNKSSDAKTVSKDFTANVIIPNGNFDVANSGFYIPLSLEIESGTTVTWINEDSVPHTIQSQDEYGNIVGLFNSVPLKTGERFVYAFEESGVYNYYCSLHPWRVGVVIVK